MNTPLGLEFINNLRPVEYKLKEENEPIAHHGLIAQELDKLIKDMNYNFGGIKNNNDNYTIGYTELIAPMIKAIQELTIKNKDLSEQAKELSEQNKELSKQTKELYNYNLKLDERINKLEKK
jgi:DNA repair ATPase RecN